MSKQPKTRRRKPRAVLTTGKIRIVQRGDWFHLEKEDGSDWLDVKRWVSYWPKTDDETRQLVLAIGGNLAQRLDRRKVRK